MKVPFQLTSAAVVQETEDSFLEKQVFTAHANPVLPGGGVLLVSSKRGGASNLRVDPSSANGPCAVSGSLGKFATFRVHVLGLQPQGDGGPQRLVVELECLAYPGTRVGAYLSPDGSGVAFRGGASPGSPEAALRITPVPQGDPRIASHSAAVAEKAAAMEKWKGKGKGKGRGLGGGYPGAHPVTGGGNAPPATAPPPAPCPRISVQDFVRDGYAFVPAAVAPGLVRDAMRQVNMKLGEPGAWERDEVNGGQLRLSGGQVQSSPEIVSLFERSSLRPLAESLLGGGAVRPVHAGQVALRFPNPHVYASGDPNHQAHDPSLRLPPQQWHIDGFNKGEIYPFSLLVGVLLADLPDENAGNFELFPGSHAVLQRRLEESGPERFLAGDRASYLDPAARTLQVRGRAGDAYIAHPMLAHRIAINAGERIRYAVYFRVQVADRDAVRAACLTNMWAAFPMVQAVGNGGGTGGTSGTNFEPGAGAEAARPIIVFDEALIRDAVAMGFPREKVVETLHAMHARGDRCDDMHLLLDRLG